jgi:cytidylate kinase
MVPSDVTAPETRPSRPGPVVALDGPASSGKSSVGAAAAERLGLRFVDTGLLYRAVTALALRNGVATDDAAGLVALVDHVSLRDDGSGRLTRVLLDGVDATVEARSAPVDEAVSAVSRAPELRAALMPLQRALADDGGILVAGRDIGTVVLPGADLKLFLDASVDERAARRISERGLDPAGPEAALVREQLRERDERDRSRAVAPLRPAEDAVVLRTDGNTLEQTVDAVVGRIVAVSAGESPASATPAASPVVRAARARPTAAPDPGPGNRKLTLLEIAMRLDNGQTPLIHVVAFATRCFLRVVTHVRIEGLERLPATGAVILAANHASNIDPLVIGAWFTSALRTRRIHWMGKKELFSWPIFGWIAANGGIHPVDRGTGDVEAYRLATKILESGFVLMIFPEGTRSPTGAMQEAKDGMATLAMRTGAMIVPIGVNNTDAVWPKGHKYPIPIPRRTVTYRVGEPFTVADLALPVADRRAAKAAVTRAVMGRIAELLDDRHRGFYADLVRPEAARGR